MYFFFFFQAEDGIRDYKVTGVQTCALPISGTRTRRPACTSRSTSARRKPTRRSARILRRLFYGDPPHDVAQLFRGKPANVEPIKGRNLDQVLDQEIVDRAR